MSKNNTPILNNDCPDCMEYEDTTCIIHKDSLISLGLKAGSTLSEIIGKLNNLHNLKPLTQRLWYQNVDVIYDSIIDPVSNPILEVVIKNPSSTYASCYNNLKLQTKVTLPSGAPSSLYLGISVDGVIVADQNITMSINDNKWINMSVDIPVTTSPYTVRLVIGDISNNTDIKLESTTFIVDRNCKM